MDTASKPDGQFLRQLYGLSDDKLEKVRQFGQSVGPRLPDVVDEFYRWLADFPEFDVFFQDSATLAHVKTMQLGYWREFLTANIDEDYIESRRRVGRAHAAIGLPVQPYFASVQHFIDILVRPLIADQNHENVETLHAITSLASLDACIALDAIFRYHADAFHRMADGDYSTTVEPRYEGDLFGIALKRMTETLQEVEAVCGDIASGSISRELTVKSAQDKLARSINDMVAQLRQINNVVNIIAEGDYAVDIIPRSEKDTLGLAINSMTRNLRALTGEREQQLWFARCLAELSENISGSLSVAQLSARILDFLCERCDATVGTLYVAGDERLRLAATYACDASTRAAEIMFGEGLPGQVAMSRKAKHLRRVPAGYLDIKSSIGGMSSCELAIIPFVHENTLEGVVELGSFQPFSDSQLELIKRCSSHIAINLSVAKSREQIAQLLGSAQQQATALARANQELEQQTDTLRRTDEQLRQQQAELENINQELEEKTEVLLRQKRSLENARAELEEKTAKLEQASRYKSEFLANMSHELRTPLNSMLLLTRLFVENTDNNLTDEQIDSAKVVFNSGNDLLNIINDILDLSKIEAGKMEVNPGAFDLNETLDNLRDQFSPLAKQRSIGFHLHLDGAIVSRITSDRAKLEQILKNLLSNAIKFTQRGYVKLNVRYYTSELDGNICHECDPYTLVFEVVDTGIGIPQNKQTEIFEAFQQADGSTSRQYGGTGLGLSICRENARLLGAHLIVESKQGEGSTFRLYLPLEATPALPREPARNKQTTERSEVAAVPAAETVNDDRDDIGDDDNCLLIIEDDPNFAKTLCKLAHEQHFKCIIAAHGETGIELARKYKPDAILLDVMLPGMDGWSVFDRIREDPQLRHIPTHFISAYDDLHDARQLGAVGFLHKPVNEQQLRNVLSKMHGFRERDINRVLLYESSPGESGIEDILKSDDIEIRSANIPADIIGALREHPYDIIVYHHTEQDDLRAFFEQLSREASDVPPVIVYSENPLTPGELEFVGSRMDSVVKNVNSAARLLDECVLFLHHVHESLSDKQKNILRLAYDHERIFNNRHVLLVDDDIRNTFAVAKLLNRKGMNTTVAENGQQALDVLAVRNDIDIILMDIMMPVMDGIEAIGHIRKNLDYADLPIIALTAKTLLSDRENCLRAGANDYLTKPIDHFRLMSMMRVWLQQKSAATA